MAGIDFLNGSFTITTKVKAATNIVPPNSNPANNATYGTHIPINIPIAPIISKAPVRKLKIDGKPNRLNSSAIFPEIIFVPVIMKKINNNT